MKLEDVPGFETLTGEQLLLLQKLPERDLLDLEQLSVEKAQLCILAYQQAATPAVADGWDLFLKILSAIASVAGSVVPVASAVSAVLGVISTAKTL